MSARVWTVDELNRVHPLPDGWVWRLDHDGLIAAQGPINDARFVSVVWVGAACRLAVSHGCIPPADVALAVILASRGWNSHEAMAAELDTRRDAVLKEAFDYAAKGEMEMSATCDGEANSYHETAAMLRRRRVQP